MLKLAKIAPTFLTLLIIFSVSRWKLLRRSERWLTLMSRVITDNSARTFAINLPVAGFRDCEATRNIADHADAASSVGRARNARRNAEVRASSAGNAVVPVGYRGQRGERNWMRSSSNPWREEGRRRKRRHFRIPRLPRPPASRALPLGEISFLEFPRAVEKSRAFSRICERTRKCRWHVYKAGR